uniref:Nodulin MtN3 family protein n=2 Tax=Solanum TaxID=4107 RepID=M1CBD7_SOLTU
MYGSPLSIIRLVIKTKSVEFMPFFLSLFVFLCGASWFAFGLLGKDPFVAIPNGFGFGLGTVQLILYAIYCEKKGFTKKSTFDESLTTGNVKSHQEEKQSSNNNKSKLEQV